MTGHTKFQRVRQQRKQHTPEREARVAQLRRAFGDIIRLADLRTERGVTQSELAEEMAVSQANISRLEREHDLYLSTLASYVIGLGGHLRIEAIFPEGSYTLMELEPESEASWGLLAGGVTVSEFTPAHRPEVTTE